MEKKNVWYSGCGYVGAGMCCGLCGIPMTDRNSRIGETNINGKKA